MKRLGLVLLILMLSASLLADEMAVTVYNSNLGVVSETRTLDFQKGTNRLSFPDVPSLIDINSVRFALENNSHRVSILEQNFAFDLVNTRKIYDRYVDKEIELIDKDGRLYKGTLLSSSDGAVVLRDKSGGIKIVRMDGIAEVNFPTLPDGLITRPTLFWLYQSDLAGSIDSRVSYQTAGLNWTAEYVGVLSSEEDRLDLSGWAAIGNTSGKTYRDASLKLVAGDIHRAVSPRPTPPRGMEMMMAEKTMGAGFEEKPFFEYHLYTLPRKATLADKEIKQISLFDPATTGVEKKFLYRPSQDPKHVEVVLEYVNSEANGLGMPLPAGRVRLFKADDDGSLILLGEDRIEHTPENEEVTLKVGTAFDIVCSETMTNQSMVSKRIEERTFEIELRNRKDEAVAIDIEKRFHGFWSVVEADFKYAKKDANTVAATISVPAGETRTLTYSVRFEYR